MFYLLWVLGVLFTIALAVIITIKAEKSGKLD